jgi:large-conductance mechanosensitive channel
MVKAINKMKRKEEKKEAVKEAVVVSNEEKLLKEIRDLLKKK